MVPTLVVERQPGVWVAEHPAARHELAILRSAATSRAEFRAAAERLGFYLAAAATTRLTLEPVEVETPLCRTVAYRQVEPSYWYQFFALGCSCCRPSYDCSPRLELATLDYAATSRP
ncbi:MAG: uracil phosphoribosyltransferase [Candidatus Kapabacteria bacterium]|nr:uracil phosphoribosyltransferase [Candidatus Kapabacteria bacterium]